MRMDPTRCPVNLAVSVPGFRLRGVTLFGPKSRPQGSVLIEYDSGKGTSLRRFVYVNQWINQGDRLQDQWWAPLLPKHGFGLVVKATRDLLQPTTLFGDLRDQLLRSPRSVAVGASQELSSIPIGWGLSDRHCV
jgi:hypothetical protein